MKNVISGLTISLLGRHTKMPMRSTDGSAGFDIFSDRKIIIPAKKEVVIKLPFAFKGELNSALEARLFVRSSFGINKKFRLMSKGEQNIENLVLNIEGDKNVINVFNDSEKDLIINEGEHFAQFIICNKVRKPKEMSLQYVPKEELLKHTILKGEIEEVTPNTFVYILGEDIILKPGEQRKFATGLRSLIKDGHWTAITTHPDARNQVMLANQTAVIDKDYAFTDNFGHCFIALVNLHKQETVIKKGTRLMSWWTEEYFVLEEEILSNNKRSGGIGST